MEKEQFEEYAKIKNQIKELTAQAKELEPELTKGMVEAGADKVKTEFGSFTLKEYTSIELSDEKKTTIKGLESTIEELEEVKKIKAQIKEIEATGEVVTRKGIMFR